MAVRAAVLAVLVPAIGALGRVGAQGSGVRDTVPFRCHWYDRAHNRLGTQALAGGFTVTISRDSSAVEDECIATVRDRANREIVREAGFSAAVDPATGVDVDGDGSPELVLSMDTGGGNHCCWSYTVVAFSPTPRKLFTFPWQGATEFRRDATGRVTLWSWEGGLFGTDRSEAGRLFAQRVYRWSGGRLVNETSAHCDAIRADTSGLAARRPTPDEIRRLATFGAGADSAYGIAGAIEQIMLQEIFCERADRALMLARTMWPADDRAKFIARYRDMIVAAYPEYAAALRDWR